MLKRPEILTNSNTANKLNKQFASNPINSIFEKIQKIDLCNDLNSKAAKVSEIVDNIHNLSDSELISLMSSENEIIRSLAARSFIDNSKELSINTLKAMLKDKNELTRDSAVMALCYANSDEVLDLLNEATQDTSKNIKLKALTGIADIASEHSSTKAKKILENFVNDANEEIRQFVNDELSFIS